MFKKQFSIGKESILSSKDRKKLQNKVKSVSLPDLRLKQNSVSGSRVKIIWEEGTSWVPVFIDCDYFFPTVFWLWKFPEYLPCIYTWPSVSSFILNGADLMWPGVANPDEVKKTMKVGEIVSIRIVGNLPIAVGILSQSSADGKGKCVNILHYYRDELWSMCQSIPNEGFGIYKVKALAVLAEADINEPDLLQEQKENNDRQEEEKKEKEKENKALIEDEKTLINENKDLVEDTRSSINENKDLTEDRTILKIENKELADSQTSTKNQVIAEENCTKVEKELLEEGKENITEENKSNKGIEKRETNEDKNLGMNIEEKPLVDFPPLEEAKTSELEETGEETKELPSLTHDQMIMAVFLTALVVAVQSSDLPMEPSVLLGYMHRCKRSYEFDFSQSSYKKIGKFLQFADKSRIITYEKSNSIDHKLITHINKQHHLFTNFVPIVSKMKNISSELKDQSSDYPKVIFTFGLTPKYEFHNFFSAVLPDRPRQIFRKEEVNSLLSKYLELKSLETSKNSVKTDDFLQKTLKCEQNIKKSEFYQKGKNFFTEGYLAEFTSGLLPSIINLGQIPMICITITKGKGKHRKITTVSNCEAYLIDMDELQSISQKTFSATGGLLKTEKKNKTFQDLQILGDHSERLPKLLNDVFKVPLTSIEIKDLS